MARIEFDHQRSEGRDAIVASFDLRGFSAFCNHADAHAHLPRFISKLFDEVSTFFADWLHDEATSANAPKMLPPDFMKYTGDGALMIWLLPADSASCHVRCASIVRALRALQQRLSCTIPQWEAGWQVNGLPRRARFGVAKGLVYPLRAKSLIFEGEVVDYAGYCINLAVRLQNHCTELDFIVHSPALQQIPDGMAKFIAFDIKGAQNEPVLLFASDIHMAFGALRSKFQPIGEDPDVRIPPFEPLPADSPDPPIISQPRFEAHFKGGPLNGVAAYLPISLPDWHLITKLRGPTGEIGEEVSDYRLKNEQERPLVYTYQGKSLLSEKQR